MGKVVSFSVYGDKDIYLVGAIKNAQLLPSIYPGWEGWFYVGNEIPPHVCSQIAQYGGKVILAESALQDTPLIPRVGCSGSLWRFLASREHGVEVMICRDADSRVNVRERAAVNEWLSGAWKFHGMRDHVHGHNIEMLAGMWGVRGHFDILPLLQGFPIHGGKPLDEEFLVKRVWPIAKKDILIHGHKGMRPFPPHPHFDGFVGQRRNADDTPGRG